jgi:hypothetical protein
MAEVSVPSIATVVPTEADDTVVGVQTGSVKRFLVSDVRRAIANPSATIGLTAKNGVATSAMRSDGAPALDQAIVPTWTGAHTFTQTMTTQDINGTAIAGNTFVKAGIGSNSAQLNGAANGVDPVIEALGVTDANVSLQIKAKGSGLVKVISSASFAGDATFGGNAYVAGQLGSANNTSAPSPTNSGVTIGGAPTWAMASFYDQALTANNRTMDMLFISGALKFRFANDARNAFLDFLTINGGQASGVTGITSTSGSGAWTHTGSYAATSDVSAGEGMAASMRMIGGTTGQAATLQSYGSTPDVSLRVSTKGSGVMAVNTGGVDRLTISGAGAVSIAGDTAITGTLSVSGAFLAGSGTLPVYTDTGTALTTPHAVRGTVALVGGNATVNLSGLAAFADATSYVVMAVNQTTNSAVRATPTSGTSFTLNSGAGTDVIAYYCIGN